MPATSAGLAASSAALARATPGACASAVAATPAPEPRRKSRRDKPGAPRVGIRGSFIAGGPPLVTGRSAGRGASVSRTPASAVTVATRAILPAGWGRDKQFAARIWRDESLAAAAGATLFERRPG